MVTTIMSHIGIYSIIMINTSQKYAQETGTNWLPSVKSISKISDTYANTSRRLVAIIGGYGNHLSIEKIKAQALNINLLRTIGIL